MLQFLDMYEGAELLAVIVAFVLVLMISLSLHEFAHAYVAHKQGDLTPKSQGRLTVNPMAHLDLIGFLLILFVGFGWAKPVQVNPVTFKHYRKGMVLVALAGVTVNFVLAFLSYPLLLLLIAYGQGMPGNLYLFLTTFFEMLFHINLILIVFNLLPIYPLDGFRLVETFSKYNNKYVQFMHQYGSFVLLGVVLLLQIFNFLYLLMTFFAFPISLFWNLILGLFL